MIEVIGDLWTYPAEWRCITTNGVVKDNGTLVMGGGCALEAKQKYPGIDEKLGNMVKVYGNKPYTVEMYKIITMPTKNHWKDDSDIDLIVYSAIKIAEFVKLNYIKSIVIPRPGCGLGGLKWEYVKTKLEPIFDTDAFIIISNNTNQVSPYNRGLKGLDKENPFPENSDAWMEWNTGSKEYKNKYFDVPSEQR